MERYPDVSHTRMRITIGETNPLVLEAVLEGERAPQTCGVFTALLPFHARLIQARWSGEAAWIPLGDFNFDVAFENHTSHPAPGEILLYPGGYSEAEILVPYGATRRGMGLGMLGRWDEGADTLRKAAALAEAAGDVFTRCRTLQAMAGIDLAQGQLTDCRERLDAALRLAEYMGNRRQIAVSHFGLSLQSLVAGDADASSMHAESALSIMHALEGSWATACQIPGLDEGSLPRGTWENAGRYLRECVAMISR
jgi:Protein of unknown function (DUF3830)